MTDPTDATEIIAAIDAGASRCRCVIVDSAARLLATATGPGAAFVPAEASRCAATIRACVAEAARSASIRLPLDGLSLGVAGIGREAERAAFIEALSPDDLARRVVVTHDAEAALWGAIPSGHGIVVIAGTGAIAFGRNRSGHRARAGGWGREIDDEGGGWWLGARILSAVLRAYDGRGPATALTAAVLSATGATDPEQLITWLRAPSRSAKEVASLALLADRAAAEGDAVADSLLDQAADALVEMAVACFRQLSQDPPTHLSTLGGLFAASAALRDRFRDRLSSLVPSLAVVPPHLPPVLGAVVNFFYEVRGHVPTDTIAALKAMAPALPGDWGYEQSN